MKDRSRQAGPATHKVHPIHRSPLASDEEAVKDLEPVDGDEVKGGVPRGPADIRSVSPGPSQ